MYPKTKTTEKYSTDDQVIPYLYIYNRVCRKSLYGKSVKSDTFHKKKYCSITQQLISISKYLLVFSSFHLFI